MELKEWIVEYDHKDGRKGTMSVTTETDKSEAFDYGNRTVGRLTTEGGTEIGYDLRYSHGDLHRVMLDEYFGAGLISAKEV